MDAGDPRQPIISAGDGGHPLSAAAMLRVLLPRMHEFGITRVADITGLDRVGIPVAIAIRPRARSVSVSQGKALDLSAAKVAALMEAIEVWHAENVDAPLRLASIAEMRATGRACAIDRLPVAARRRRESTRALWIEGRDLVSGATKLVPFEMVHADYAPPVKPGHGFFPASTNGLASGAAPDDAIRAAICELIERDALSLWHRRPLAERSLSRLDLSTVDDPDCLQACRLIEAAALSLAVWEVTSDIGIAAFLCLVTDSRAGDGHVGLGSGAHPDGAVALLRALTEAAQTRLTYISGARDDLDAEEFTALGHAGKRHMAEALLRAGPPQRAFRHMESGATAADDVRLLLERLKARGMEEVIIVDLGRPGSDLFVMRAIVPGLEAPHDEPDYVPGPRALAIAGPSA